MSGPGLAFFEVGPGMKGLIGRTPMSQALASELLSLQGSADSSSIFVTGNKVPLQMLSCLLVTLQEESLQSVAGPGKCSLLMQGDQPQAAGSCCCCSQQAHSSPDRCWRHLQLGVQ